MSAKLAGEGAAPITPPGRTPPTPQLQAALAVPELAWKVLTAASPTSPTKFHKIKIAARQRQNEHERRAEKLFAVHQKVTEAIRSRKTYEEIRDLIRASQAVVVSLPNERQMKVREAVEGKEAVAKLMNTSYRQQGNLDMYSSENMKIRQKNRHHPEVKSAIERFWGLLPKTPAGNINKSVYTWYSRHLFFTFVSGATEKEFLVIVEEDWKNDAVWSCSMHERMFSYAIFNLADTWCETTDWAEYRDFINRCADIIAAAPPYTGSRAERDVTETEGRATARRLSTQPGVDGRRRLSGVEVFDEVQDEEDPIEESLEQLDRDILNAENNAWYSELLEFGGIGDTEVAEGEEDILRTFDAVQDRRYDLYGEPDDPSYSLKKNFEDETAAAATEREERNKVIRDRRELLKRSAPTKGDLATRRKRRERECEQHHKEQREILGELRNQTLEGFVRMRRYLNTLKDLSREALKDSMSRVSDTQSDLRAFLELQLADMSRRAGADAERNDDYFTCFADVTRDVEEFRRYILRRQSEPLENEIFDPSGQKDTEEVKFDNAKWVTACEWVEKLRMIRNESIENVLCEIDELVTRQQFRGKQQLFAIHRQQLEFEGKLIDALAETNLLENEIKIARLADATKAKEAGTVRRASESESFQGLVTRWKDVVTALQQSHTDRLAQEAKEVKTWLKSTKIDEAFEPSRVVLEHMAKDIEDMETAEIVAETPRITVELPAGATTPLQLLRFVIAQNDTWYISLLEKVATIRLRVVQEGHQFLRRVETDEEFRQFDNNLFLLNMRLDDIHRIKGELSPEEVRHLLTVSCQGRLQHSTEVKGAVHEIQELYDATKASEERFLLFLDQRFAERLAATSSLFAQARYHLFKFLELEQARLQIWESRYLNQTAAARRAVLQALQASNLRIKEEERLRAAREKRLLDERDAEERRIAAQAAAAEEQRRLQEKKELKAKDQLEIRKKHLKEREDKMLEKLAKEREERKAWREAFHVEATAYRENFRKNSTYTPPPAGQRAPAGNPGAVRRKSKVATQGNSRQNRIKQSIQAEIDMYQQLNTQSRVVDVNDFNTRRMEYFVEEASNRSIYLSECKRLKVDPKPSVEILLSDEKLDFQLSTLPLSHFVDVQIRPLFDVIALNPVQKIVLRGTNLDKDDLKKLAQTILQHPFVHILDVSSNSDLGPHGGQALLALAKENANITSIVADHCGIEESVLREIAEQTKKNQFVRGFSRSDFEYIRKIFDKIDLNHNGAIDAQEIMAFVKNGAVSKRGSTQGTIAATEQATIARQQEIKKVLAGLDPKEVGTMGLTLADLLVTLYPQFTAKRAEELVARYADESDTSADYAELQEFMDTFGANGALTIEQLAKGLEDDVTNLAAAFQEADIDDDGLLNIEEFVLFVNK